MKPGHVIQIAIIIWGTAYAARIYQDSRSAHLRAHKYVKLTSDTTFYVERVGKKFIYIAVTVDAFAIATNIK